MRFFPLDLLSYSYIDYNLWERQTHDVVNHSVYSFRASTGWFQRCSCRIVPALFVCGLADAINDSALQDIAGVSWRHKSWYLILISQTLEPCFRSNQFTGILEARQCMQGRRLGSTKGTRTPPPFRTTGPLFEVKNLIWIGRCSRPKLCSKSFRSTLLHTICSKFRPPTAGICNVYVIESICSKRPIVEVVFAHFNNVFFKKGPF